MKKNILMGLCLGIEEQSRGANKKDYLWGFNRGISLTSCQNLATRIL